MRALVTGSAGFIGRHMVRELKARGWDVDDVDIVQDDWKLPSNGSWETTADDLLSFLWLDTPVYDLVVHAAYHVGGRAAIDGVNTNFAKNLQLDAAMFEWAVRTKQKRVLYFSSSAAYPISLQDKTQFQLFGHSPNQLRLFEGNINDANPGLPDSNYGWAKLTGERLASDARRNGLSVTVVRPFSGYGEDQSLDYPFPSIVQRAKEGDLSVWGPPGQCRDWIHVSDVVKGSLSVVESGTTEPVNLCTGRAVEMGELAQMAYFQSHQPPDGQMGIALYSPVPTYDESKPTGVFYRVGDPTRMLQYYTPKVTLEEGVRRALRALE